MNPVDVRDRAVPVIRAREELEALLWFAGATARLADDILRLADRYATAATADHAGLDAMLGPQRLADATAEFKHGRGRR